MLLKTILILLFAATIPVANWMIGNIGTVCVPDGPCLIPVGFGLLAPSGVLVIGVALVLRDAVQERGGVPAAVLAIAIGGLLSWFVSPSALVIASVSAFVLAELADLFVYTPLRRKNLGIAVLASGAVGAVVDSALFLWLAFGSLSHFQGNTIGKIWMSAVAFLLIAAVRAIRSREIINQ